MRVFSVVFFTLATAIGLASANPAPQGGIECPVTPNCELICEGLCPGPAGVICNCPIRYVFVEVIYVRERLTDVVLNQHEDLSRGWASVDIAVAYDSLLIGGKGSLTIMRLRLLVTLLGYVQCCPLQVCCYIG
jgi:hypothetical protein